MAYKIKLDIFEGPLDLLLYLVRKNHLNIYDIPIADITDQYIEYLNLMQMLDLNIAGEFIVMAATLMQIKSKMLLPAQENEQEEQEEDPRAELVRRLLEYERFKEIANSLREKEEQQREVFKRPRSERPQQDAAGNEPVYFEANIFDLINAFTQALKDVPRELFYEVVKDEFSVDEKIHTILHMLLLKQTLPVADLFNKAANKIEIIVTFLAVLELVKMREVVVLQSAAFGDIVISRNQDNIVPLDEQPGESDASTS
jgi:segregation and condensation protein A